MLATKLLESSRVSQGGESDGGGSVRGMWGLRIPAYRMALSETRTQ
jgi:hypothetical protein